MEVIVETRWVLLVVLIVLSGFFSASETALMSLNRIQVKQLVRKKRKGAETLLRIRQNTHKLLSTILIGNNLANVGASAIVTAIAIEMYGSVGVGIATGAMTFIILVFGEISPKSYAVRNATEISLFVAPLFEALSFLLSPLIWVLDHINNFMMFIFRASGKKESLLTEDEITSIVSIGAEEGAIKEQEREMIYNIFKFDDIPVSDIMVPWPEVNLLDADKKISALLTPTHIATLKEYSRFPVFEDSEDNIIGIFYFKKALGYLGKNTNKRVRDFILPTLFVPETTKIDTLFAEFQKKKVHMALVVNEHGAVEGIVTLEDVLEEIVGEIQDETDMAPTTIREVKNNTYLVKGSVRVDEINEELGLNLDEDEADTIAGFMSAKLERIPKKGEKLVRDGVTLKVESAGKRRIKSVRITVRRK